MDNCTLITASYNTPDVTLTMLKSFVNVHNFNYKQPLILVDNSTNTETADILVKNNVPYISNPNGTHGNGVNIAFLLCKTKYALLVDTDIIFLKNHLNIFEIFKKSGSVIAGQLQGDRGGKSLYPRIAPHHCFIDIEQINSNKIIFFNELKMKTSFNSIRRYDIGSTFLEDILQNGLTAADVDFSKYFIHMEGSSWHCNLYDPTKDDTGIDFGGTHNSKQLYEYGQLIRNRYTMEIEKYKNIDISKSFV